MLPHHSIARAKIAFFGCLVALVGLLCFSFLEHREASFYECLFVLALLVTALVFDYSHFRKFFEFFEREKMIDGMVDRSFETALRKTLRSPFMLKLFGTELRTLYYAFFAKFEQRGLAKDSLSFAYSKASNARDVFLFVAFSQLPFVPFIHAFVEYKKGPAPAWFITLVTLWSVIWYLAQVEAVRFRPIELKNSTLKYKFGLFWKANIPLRKIKTARKNEVIDNVDETDCFLSPLGSKKNIILEFTIPITFVGPYFSKRTVRRAVISLDEPNSFLVQLSSQGVTTT